MNNNNKKVRATWVTLIAIYLDITLVYFLFDCSTLPFSANLFIASMFIVCIHAMSIAFIENK